MLLLNKEGAIIMRIGLALPHTRKYYDALFVKSFFSMERPFDMALLTPNSTGPIDTVRNELCMQALMLDCTHVFWMDCDQVYPPNTLTRLISHNLPIVCAKVHRRHPPYDALLKRYNPDKEDKLEPYVDIEYDEWALRANPLELLEVDATGFGCNLLAIEVIEKMKRPWFMMNLYVKPVIGEDMYFWEQAKKLGYKIMVDCSINVGHISEAVVDQRTYVEWRKMQISQGLG